jgi:S-methylmethionine-dependent homocysteine/selenocysteine methylase
MNATERTQSTVRARHAAAALEPSTLAGRLAAGPPVVLDGALGTELERRGVRSALPLWSTHALLQAPALVRTIHREYAEAGAEILTANTFRTQRRTLARAGLGERAEELTRLAIRLAQEAISETRLSGSQALVAGSAPTLEDCYRPDLVPDDDALAREHAEHAEHLAAAGVDLILCETLNSVREARAAARAAHGTGRPLLVSFVCGSDARLLSGEDLAAGLDAVAPYAPHAVLVNCLPLEDVEPCLRILAAGGLPFGVYANLGAPSEAGGTGWSADAPPELFADAGADWVARGARIAGGCCGTRPQHVAALARRLRAAGPTSAP